MAEVKANNIAAGRSDRSAKRHQLVCCSQCLVTVRDDLQKIARPNDRAVAEIGNLGQALLCCLLRIDHWRHKNACGRAIALIGSHVEGGHRRIEIGIRKAGAVACVGQKVGDYGCRVGVIAVGARHRLDTFNFYRKIRESRSVTKLVVIAGEVRSPGIAQRFCGMIAHPKRIGGLTVFTKVDGRETSQCRQCGDVLIPPYDSHASDRTLAHPHNERSRICVLLTTALAATAALAFSSCFRRRRCRKVVIVEEIACHPRRTVHERDNAALLRCLELERSDRFWLLGI